MMKNLAYFYQKTKTMNETENCVKGTRTRLKAES